MASDIEISKRKHWVPILPGLPDASVKKAIGEQRLVVPREAEEFNNVPVNGTPNWSETTFHQDATDGMDMAENPNDYPCRDFFFDSEKVLSLNNRNFTTFLSRKEATMVLFYKDQCKDSMDFQKIFSEAASSTKRENHAFAGVDCSSNSQLCYNNGISKVPVMRLYSKSFCIGEMKTIHTISADILRQYVEMAPVSDSTRMVACTRPAR